MPGPFDPGAAARANAGKIQSAFQTQRASGQPGPTAGFFGGGGPIGTMMNRIQENPKIQAMEKTFSDAMAARGGARPVTAPIMQAPPAAGPPPVAPSAPAAAPPPQQIMTPAPPPGPQLAAHAPPVAAPGLIAR